tara:strand:- start:50 stop:877 length:828 start_codon:yes stop_codon:yes gene_type:complete
MTILHWIRAAANANLTPGCKAFCLELVPQMSSSTLSSHFSTSRMASKVSAALPSVKVYRRQLIREGLLRSGKGWELTLPGEEKKSLTGICGDTKRVSVEISENVSRYTQGSQKGISGDPKKVSPQIPVLYKGTSAFFSASYSTENKLYKADSIPSLDDLSPEHRPDIGDRIFNPEVSLDLWFNKWRSVKGADFPWKGWALRVLPYLEEKERERLMDALLSSSKPNLKYAKVIVSRMCQGLGPRHKHPQTSRPGSVPVVIPGRSEEDDLWLEIISN